RVVRPAVPQLEQGRPVGPHQDEAQDGQRRGAAIPDPFSPRAGTWGLCPPRCLGGLVHTWIHHVRSRVVFGRGVRGRERTPLLCPSPLRGGGERQGLLPLSPSRGGVPSHALSPSGTAPLPANHPGARASPFVLVASNRWPPVKKDSALAQARLDGTQKF